MLAAARRSGPYRFDGYWRDVGTIVSLWDANMDMLGNTLMDLFDATWPVRSKSPDKAAALRRPGQQDPALHRHRGLRDIRPGQQQRPLQLRHRRERRPGVVQHTDARRGRGGRRGRQVRHRGREHQGPRRRARRLRAGRQRPTGTSPPAGPTSRWARAPW